MGSILNCMTLENGVCEASDVENDENDENMVALWMAKNVGSTLEVRLYDRTIFSNVF